MKHNFIAKALSGSILLTMLIGCSSNTIPQGIEPITGFQAEKYLGTWYEVARINNHFEKNIDQAFANYSLRDDGGMKVVNKGYNTETKQWQESIGKAYFVKSPNIGALKVSFFGPFYGGYNIVKLDNDYQTVLIAGSSKDYLWILSRTPCISEKTKKAYVEKAKTIGYDVSRLNFDVQTNANCQIN